MSLEQEIQSASPVYGDPNELFYMGMTKLEEFCKVSLGAVLSNPVTNDGSESLENMVDMAFEASKMMINKIETYFVENIDNKEEDPVDEIKSWVPSSSVGH